MSTGLAENHLSFYGVKHVVLAAVCWLPDKINRETTA